MVYLFIGGIQALFRNNLQNNSLCMFTQSRLWPVTPFYTRLQAVNKTCFLAKRSQFLRKGKYNYIVKQIKNLDRALFCYKALKEEPRALKKLGEVLACGSRSPYTSFALSSLPCVLYNRTKYSLGFSYPSNIYLRTVKILPCPGSFFKGRKNKLN